MIFSISKNNTVLCYVIVTCYYRVVTLREFQSFVFNKFYNVYLHEYIFKNILMMFCCI